MVTAAEKFRRGFFWELFVMPPEWFEVVDRGVIIFAGPLDKCGDHLRSFGDYGYDLIIRPVSF